MDEIQDLKSRLEGARGTIKWHKDCLVRHEDMVRRIQDEIDKLDASNTSLSFKKERWPCMKKK
jgi:hypothetical protein